MTDEKKTDLLESNLAQKDDGNGFLLAEGPKP
jgi:hypothetical protein